MKEIIQNILPTLLQLVYSICSFYIYSISSMLFFGEGEGSFMYTTINSVILVVVTFILPIAYNLFKVFSNKILDKLKYKIAIIFNIIEAIMFYIFFV